MRAVVLKRLLVVLVVLKQVSADSEMGCDGDRRPTITARDSNRESHRSSLYQALVYLYPTFGEDITISCTADDATYLSIEADGQRLPTTKLGSHGIQPPVQKPFVGQHEYICRDNRTECGDVLLVGVRPSVSLAERFRYTFNEDGARVYFVGHGDEFEVFCSGTGKMQIFASGLNPVQTESVNVTAARYKAQANDIGEKNFYCRSDSASDYYSDTLIVVVDFYPDGRDFQCLFYQWRELKCQWNSSSARNTFMLFYHDGTDTIPCEMSGEIAICPQSSDLWKHSLTLSLKTCNEISCVNQTFILDPKLIAVIIDAPSELKIHNVSARSAAVTWRRPLVNDEYLNYVYKIEYRLQGLQWREANASSTRCVAKNCKYQLSFLCPDSMYEVRVYTRLADSPTEDRFWSKPASVYFYTQNIGNMMEPTISLNNELCEVGELAKYAINKKLAIKKIMSTWKGKLAKIKAHLDLLSAYEADSG